MNRQKMRRSRHKQSYYERQFQVTIRHKAARSARRHRRKVDQMRVQMLKKMPV